MFVKKSDKTNILYRNNYHKTIVLESELQTFELLTSTSLRNWF